ncbi:MAG: ATP-binding cassette domain-containing protein [Clostridia bacterium]|nr:ATP-binding cassette domain-containing protein [Clostridia bacterium]
MRFIQQIWKEQAMPADSELTRMLSDLTKSGSIMSWPDFDHVIPDWDSLMRLGFPGILERIRHYRQVHLQEGTLTPERKAFFDGMELEYEAVLRLLDRLRAYALAHPSEKGEKAAACLLNLRQGSPETTYEALMAVFLFFMVCEHVDNYQTRSLGNGLDQTLYPFYCSDLEKGTAQEELETYNLTLPRSVKICQKLRTGGVAVNDTLSPETLAADIARCFEKIGVQETDFSVKENETDGAGLRLNAENGDFDVVSENLTHVYNPLSPFETYALNGVDLRIKKGAFFGVIGHTGSGKSTFVQYLNALKKLPTAEKKYKPKKRKKSVAQTSETVLTVNGYDLTDKTTDFKTLRAKVGMVFQYPEYQLFAETVFEDVAFGLKNFSEKPLSPEETARAVKAAIETVGLDYAQIKNRSPFELSGGQKRRVAIAGVIVTKPEILVLDEPAAGLDPLGKEEIMELLHKIHRDWCRTVIIVSHDMDEIAENCTDAAVFSDGKVVLKSAPKELFVDPDPLMKIGLDVPFTAKVCAALKENGYCLKTDFTAEDFVKKTLDCIRLSGVGMRVTQETATGGAENE